MHRREFFAAGAAVLVPATGFTAVEGDDDCERHASALAAAMKSKYGGDWRVNIEPSYGFVVVVKDG